MATLGPLEWLFGDAVYTTTPPVGIDPAEYIPVNVLPTLTNGVKWYSLAVELDGSPFTIEVNWNARAESWTASLLDSEGIIAISRVLCGTRLWDYTNPRLPDGLFTVAADSGVAPGLLELGSTFKMIYIDAATTESL